MGSRGYHEATVDPRIVQQTKARNAEPVRVLMPALSIDRHSLDPCPCHHAFCPFRHRMLRTRWHLSREPFGSCWLNSPPTQLVLLELSPAAAAGKERKQPTPCVQSTAQWWTVGTVGDVTAQNRFTCCAAAPPLSPVRVGGRYTARSSRRASCLPASIRSDHTGVRACVSEWH